MKLNNLKKFVLLIILILCILFSVYKVVIEAFTNNFKFIHNGTSTVIVLDNKEYINLNAESDYLIFENQVELRPFRNLIQPVVKVTNLNVFPENLSHTITEDINKTEYIRSAKYKIVNNTQIEVEITMDLGAQIIKRSKDYSIYLDYSNTFTAKNFTDSFEFENRGCEVILNHTRDYLVENFQNKSIKITKEFRANNEVKFAFNLEIDCN